MTRHHQPGCYGDGSFGHQHTRERCADMLEDTVNRLADDGRLAPEGAMATIDALRADMSDDASEEIAGCDLLNVYAPHPRASWGWDDGSFGLWLEQP